MLDNKKRNNDEKSCSLLTDLTDLVLLMQ